MKYRLKSLINFDELLRFAPDDESGGGPSDDRDGDNREILGKLQKLIDKQGGDSGAVALELYQENFRLRERNRQLREQIPAEGTVILSKDQAEQWQAYQNLGAPKDLEQAIKDRDQAQGDLAQVRRSSAIREAADLAGYKASVLAGLDTQAGGTLAYEVREVEEDGAKQRVAYVKDGDTEAVPLAQYAENKWGDFLPALKLEGAQRPGTPYPTQTGSNNKPPAPDLVTEFQQKQEEANKRFKNPLRPE